MRDEEAEGPAGSETGPETAPLARHVTVKALGYLSRRLPGGGPLRLPLPEGGDLSVAEAMRLAGLPDEEVFLAVVNGKRATPDRVLAPGDEVTFVPPVAGG